MSVHLPISVEFSWMLEINTGFSVRHARFEDGQKRWSVANLIFKLKICAFCLEIGMIVKCDWNWRLQLLVDTARRTLPQLQLCKTRIRGDIHTDSVLSAGLGKKQGDQQKGLYSLLSVWTGCFKACQGLKSGEEQGLQLLSEQVDTLVEESLKNEEVILDIWSTGHSC